MCHRPHDVLGILQHELDRQARTVLMQPITLDYVLLGTRRDSILVWRTIVREVFSIDYQNIILP